MFFTADDNTTAATVIAANEAEATETVSQAISITDVPQYFKANFL